MGYLRIMLRTDLSMMSLFEYLINWFPSPDAVSSEMTFKMIPRDQFSDRNQLEDIELPSALEVLKKVFVFIFDKQSALQSQIDSINVRFYPAEDGLLVFNASSNSFHISLYRFLGCVTREACRYDHFDETLSILSSWMPLLPKITMIEILLHQFSFETGIRIGNESFMHLAFLTYSLTI